FGTLCWGGRLVLVENALALPEVAGQGIVYASMVPTAAAELLRAGAIPPEVKTLNLGGEPLPAGLARALLATGTVEKVGNLYGPTEDTTYSTYGRVERGAGRVLVGRPVADTRAYVLDGRLHPVPVGVVGELYLAGGGTARGYAGRPELTAERFLPDPFGPPGTRMYRVMDRVRWTAGGELEYFGRTDFQVKVRGFRIELGEIETALEQHEGVHRAVAVVREDAASGGAGDRRIVAYVVGSAAEADAAGLRAHLRERLPEYMLPAAFVALAEFPLTASGKVDRRALPAPEAGEAAREEYAAPRDALEAAIAGIFEEVLGVARVGLRDGFFELGGHSLLAVQVMSRLEKATGVRLPVAVLFTAPTVEQLAEEVRGGGGGPRPLLAPIRPGGSRPPLFLVHPVGGDVMAYAALAASLDPEQPLYGLRARGVEPGENPNWTVEEMVRDYLAELRREQPAGPYRLGGWSMGGVVAFEMARRLEAEGERVDRLVLVDSQVPWLRDPDREMPRNVFELVQLFVRDLGLADDPLPPVPGAGESEYLHQLLESARLDGTLPGGLDPGRMHHLYGIFRINLRALYEYRPGSYGGPATLLRPASRAITERLLERKTVGWERVVRGGVEVRTVPGDHYTMVREPQAAALAREIERALE
ncbi:MAG: thioesterase domain-containing protein, partial [Longimicrobiaceae bacterium]